jgi:hypothetical protein
MNILDAQRQVEIAAGLIATRCRSRKEAVPRDGALTLSDIREPALTIACERRSRYGRYNVKRLAAAHGADARLPDLFGDARQL